MPISKASNAVLAKARAMYGQRLKKADYQSLAECRTMPELATALKTKPLYAAALSDVSPATARRANLEIDLRKSIFERYASLCRFEMSAGENVYRYFIYSCDLDEITTWLRYLDSGKPGDYLFVLPDFLQKHTQLNLYALANARSIEDLLNVLQGTPYGPPLAALAELPPNVSALAHAAPILEKLRHEALVSLSPKKAARASIGSQPSIRDYLEWECDCTMITNAARMKRIGLEPSQIRVALQLDCTSLTREQWDAMLTAPDLDTFHEALGKTTYGHALSAETYDHMQEGMDKVRFRWCRKWLRFSTDPTLVMLCYIFLARDEVKSLNHIVEGVHYGLSAADILPLLNGYQIA